MLKIRKLGVFIIVLSVIAVTFLMELPTFIKYKKGEFLDFNLVGAGELQKGDLVVGIVDMTLGACAEEYSTTYGVRTSKESSKLYYVLWMDNEQFIVYETGNKDEFVTLDKIEDETYSYFQSIDEAEDESDLVYPSTTMEIQGVVKKLPSNIEGYFRSWYTDIWDDGDFDNSTETVMISRVQFDKLYITIIIGGVCGVLALALIAILIVAFVRTKREQEPSMLYH